MATSDILESDWDPRSRQTYVVDLLAMLMAAALPWSTTVFSILTGLWLFAFAAVAKPERLIQLFKSSRCAAPAALFGLCVIGMFWSNAPWDTKLHAASTFVKLLAIPLLVYQFERSNNGINVLLAFLASCTILLLLSWINWFDHRTVLFSARVIGVPVKNWITQGVEFVLCIFGAAALSIVNLRAHRHRASVCFALLSLLFLFNLIFVVSSRTALISIPILFLIATFRYGDRRQLFFLYSAAVLAAVAIWFVSPNLRSRLESLQSQFTRYETGAELASVGLRLEYWKKSMRFLREAPILGHGTGSIRSLFESDATGKTTEPSEIVANPHNQILYCAIQWGILGALLLIAMWVSHLLTFAAQGWYSWIGLIIVSQNIFSSLFNSHITDFVEGWIYVMGVGIVAGMTLGFQNRACRAARST